MLIKKCKKCKTNKNLSEFYRDKLKQDGRVDTCKVCASVYYRKHYQLNKDKYREWQIKNRNKDLEKYRKYYRDYQLKKNFNLTPEQYESMFDKQDRKCAICKREKSKSRMAVDHCHKTGKIRGILCLYCNRGLGLFQDDIELLKISIKYLKNNL